MAHAKTTPCTAPGAPALSLHTHALSRHVPAMANGFTIVTAYGELAIEPGPTAKRIAALVEKMLHAELAKQAKQNGGAA